MIEDRYDYLKNKYVKVDSFNKCWFDDCYSTETKYCPACDKWLCNKCRKDYYKRMKGFSRVIINKAKEKLTWNG